MRARPAVRLILTTVAVVASCLVASGCDKGSPSSRVPTAPTSSAPTPPSGQVVRLGEPISGTITADSGCTFAVGNSRFADLCDVFTLTPPEDGTLVAEVRVMADAALALRFRSASGEIIDAFCCTQMTGRLPVRAGSLVKIELAYIGRPPGYPAIQPVAYTLEFSLFTGDLQQRGKLQAIVFGDPTRTQRLPNVRLEVLDGPRAGLVAGFDDVTGLYELLDLSPGFVRLHASAPGFDSAEEEFVVGAQRPREITLQRTVPLVDANRTLWGMAPVPGSLNSFLTGVKIEILDGPLAGVFTFTDDDMAMYTLRSLPPGWMLVRASRYGLTQTLSVELSASTTALSFDFGQR